MIFIDSSPHIGHSAPCLGPSLASSAAILASSFSTCGGRATSFFHTGIRSRVLLMSSSNPMPFSLLTKCKRRNLHGISDSGKGAHSMHRHRPSICAPSQMVENESQVYAFDVIVGRIVKRLIGQIGRAFKQCVSRCFGQAVEGQSGSSVGFYFFHGVTVRRAAQQRNAEINLCSR